MPSTSEILERYELGLVPPRNTRCHACMIPSDIVNGSEVRRRIASMYVEGWGDRAIYRSILPLMKAWPAGAGGPRISRPGLYRHLKHLDDVLQGLRKAVEVQAELDGIDLEAFAGRYVTGRSIIKKALVHGDNLLSSDKLKMTFGDLIRVAQVDHALEAEGDLRAKLAAMAADSQLLIAVVNETVPQELRNVMIARIAALKGEQARELDQPSLPGPAEEDYVRSRHEEREDEAEELEDDR